MVVVSLCVLATVSTVLTSVLALTLVRKADREAIRIAVLAQAAFDRLLAKSLTEVKQAEAFEQQAQTSLRVYEEEITKPQPQAPQDDSDKYAVTADGRKIPWENLEAAIDTTNLEPL